MKKPSQLLESRGLHGPGKFAKHLRNKMKKGLRPRSGEKNSEVLMKQYLITGRRKSINDKWRHLTMDAGRVAGRDWLLIANWSVERKLGHWLPPKVRYG